MYLFYSVCLGLERAIASQIASMKHQLDTISSPLSHSRQFTSGVTDLLQEESSSTSANINPDITPLPSSLMISWDEVENSMEVEDAAARKEIRQKMRQQAMERWEQAENIRLDSINEELEKG